MGGILGKFSRLSISKDVLIKRDAATEEAKEVDESFPEESCATPQRKFITEQLLDPRSVTLGIKRTPLILARFEECEKEENQTPVKPKPPYLETDLDEAVEAEESDVQETENCVPITPESCHLSESEKVSQEECAEHEEMDEEGGKEEELTSDTIVDADSDNEIIYIQGKIVNSPAVFKTKMSTLIYEDSTPTSESTPVKPKNGRTPLGVVNSSPLPSPLGGGKPWRGFHEERMRLGLENTPPGSGPFLESVQSAPGKVGARRTKKWTRANWAQDESLII